MTARGQSGQFDAWLRIKGRTISVVMSCDLPIKDTLMPRYYFDLRDGEDLTPDEIGLELSSFPAAQEEAARSLADLEALRTHHIDGAGGQLAVAVRDDAEPVLQARFSVNVNRKQT